ncbi:DNA translocase FtsK [Candidatus Dependentiae bacterium]|nr:DNA translocase FtsK [Candidatus Dependentiae bacterium]
MFQLKVRELSVIVLSAITVILFFSLYSYNPHDSSLFYYTSQELPITNWCGAVGAHIAAFFFYLFGAASFVLVAIAIFVIYILFARHSFVDEWDRLTALATSVFIGASGFSMYGIGGGRIGTHVYMTLFYLFDDIGTTVFLYTMVLMCCVIVLRDSFFSIIYFGFCVIQFLVSPRFLIPVYRMVATVFVCVTSMGIWCFNSMKKVFEGFAVDESDQSLMAFEYDFIDDEETNFDAFSGISCAPLIQFNVQKKECEQDQYSLTIQKRQEVLSALQHSLSTNTNGQISVQNNEGRSQQPLHYNMQQVDDAQQQEVTDAHVQDTSGHIAYGQEIDHVSSFSFQKQDSYRLPSESIFIGVQDEKNNVSIMHQLEQRARTLEKKLERFGISGNVIAIKRGPVVTLFEYKPDIDAKISKIIALEDDLAMALQALSIRIIAPIPGRSVVGFEVANTHRTDVLLAKGIQSDKYKQFEGSLPLILGEDTVGNDVVVDLAKMPHLLIAGSTGSGKSVCLNAMLISLLCNKSPDDLRLILIDPKRLEFASYTDIAHLIFPIVTDHKKASSVLRWVVQEMERRYQLLAECGVRSIHDYRALQKDGEEIMPFIIVVIDELADLMMTASNEVEDLITRIAQMARAAGIHVILATQRPSVDVITGLIKVNFPSRISFRVTSKIDSRTILDGPGAEKLLGCGDMLFLDSHAAKVHRVHGSYVSDDEIMQVTNHIRAQRPVQYQELAPVLNDDTNKLSGEDDQLYNDVLNFLDTIDEISISLLQRKFRIGYNRSARIIDMLEAQGIIEPPHGGKARKVNR